MRRANDGGWTPLRRMFCLIMVGERLTARGDRRIKVCKHPAKRLYVRALSLPTTSRRAAPLG